ncbi:MAG: GntR family transcriptional regulator [Phycisphaerae bacterium]|nr:GntR family transcriptional regulator [Phycisphaerae bacterium]
MSASLQDQAYDHLRRFLIAGRWPEGALLLPGKLASRLGMSPTPVREAIIRLESEGLVETIPKRGVRLRRLTREDLEHAFDLRMVIEGGAARFAAERITQPELTDIERNLAEQREDLSAVRHVLRETPEASRQGTLLSGTIHERGARLNVAFHLALMRASRNPRLIKIVGDLHVLTVSLQDRVHPPGEPILWRMARDYAFHRCIVRALRRRDGRAARKWTEKHVLDAKKYHLAGFDWRRRERNLRQGSAEWSPETLEVILHMEDGLRHAAELPPDEPADD